MPLLTEEDVKSLATKPVINETDSFDFYNPSQIFQEGFTGVSFETAYLEALRFLNHVFEKIEADSGPYNFKGKRIVDFGSGWGRMLRLLRTRRELDETFLYGCEQHAGALRLCEKTVPRVCFSQTSSFPPCDLRSGFIDLVYAYSVFSHLNAPPHLAWAQEIHRILKPGGYTCVTVQRRAFISLCREYRDGSKPMQNNWHKLLSGAFLDEADCLKRYDAGELVFDYSTGGAGLTNDVYGDAIVPKAFFEKHWTRLGFRLVDFFEPPSNIHAQARVLLQKLP